MLMHQWGRGGQPSLPGNPITNKERKTYHHEVELTVHRTDGLKDKCDPGHLFVLCVRHHRLWRSVGQKLKVSSETGQCLLQSPESSRGSAGRLGWGAGIKLLVYWKEHVRSDLAFRALSYVTLT